jgi:hypothetical protein
VLPFTIVFSEEVTDDDEETLVGTATFSESFEIILSDDDRFEFDFCVDNLKSIREMKT